MGRRSNRRGNNTTPTKSNSPVKSIERISFDVLDKPAGIFCRDTNSCYIVSALQCLTTILFNLKSENLVKMNQQTELILKIYGNNTGTDSFMQQLIKSMIQDKTNFPYFSKYSMGDAMDTLLGLICFCKISPHCEIKLENQEPCDHCGFQNPKLPTKLEFEMFSFINDTETAIETNMNQLRSCRKCKQINNNYKVEMPQVLIIRCPKESIRGFKIQPVISFGNVTYNICALIHSNGVHAFAKIKRNKWFLVDETKVYNKDNISDQSYFLLGTIYIVSNYVIPRFFPGQLETREKNEEKDKNIEEIKPKTDVDNFFPINDNSSLSIIFQFMKISNIKTGEEQWDRLLAEPYYSRCTWEESLDIQVLCDFIKQHKNIKCNTHDIELSSVKSVLAEHNGNWVCAFQTLDKQAWWQRNQNCIKIHNFTVHEIIEKTEKVNNYFILYE